MIRLHIDKAALAQGSPEPIIVREFNGKGTEIRTLHAMAVEILGASRFIFSPLKPLPPAGTYAWIETHAKVKCLKLPPPDVEHSHRCAHCGTRWSHVPDATVDHVAAHTCPRCGRLQYAVAVPESQTFSVSSALAATLFVLGTATALFVFARLASGESVTAY
jgi:hypothetical protein